MPTSQTGNPSILARKDVASHFHPYTNLRAIEKDAPLMIVRGDGIEVIDDAGKRYIEGMAGLWCASLGFSEPRLAEAAKRQMDVLPYYHSFSGKAHNVVAELSEKLISLAPTPALQSGRVIFANSGSEANDTAFKLVRYYHNAIGKPLKKKVIARGKGYHGVTVAAASMSGIPIMHQHFDLPIDGVLRVSCPHAYQFANDGESPEAFATRLADELETLILKEGPDTIGGFIAEPIQGAGGVIVPPPTYFEKVQAILKKYEILFIADEVITGFGRTGNLFGTQTYRLEPDMLTTAKMITSAYVPLSALYVNGRIYQACADASASAGVFGHGYTYSGHPLGCAVALETLRIYEERRVLEHVRAMTPVFQRGLQAFAAHPLIGDVRSVGLIGAVELAEDKAARKAFATQRGVGAWLVRRAQAHGLILRVMGGDIIAFSPPLIINEAQIAEMMRRFSLALDDTVAWLKSA
ncbi:MAG: aminotransferase class III-fold pyridoxal phosphate-dependent enzyme [Burkholderiales bacterium]|nr:aminotransferase class III-fold pyridoxal phosphate-dependent enzyme [Burkholderiales bacterium]